MSHEADFFILNNGTLCKYKGSDTDVVIPDGVNRIDQGVFCDSPQLTSITLPPSVTFIMSNAFDGCVNFKRIYISDLSAYMKIRHFGMSYRFPGLLKGRELYLNGKLVEDLEIPGDIEQTGNMFREYDMLKSVSIPESVIQITKEAFAFCKNLRKVTIARGLKHIYYDSFDFTENVTLCIPDLDYYYEMPQSWKKPFSSIYIETNPLLHCEIEPGTTEIKEQQFARLCQLESISIPDTVTSIGAEAFICCNNLVLESLPDSVTAIGKGAFAGCSKLNLKRIPDNVTHICSNAFSSCTGISELKLPQKLEVIESYAFYRCTGLKALTIPASVKEIGTEIIANCDNLTDVYFESVAGTMDKDAFANSDSLTIHFAEKVLATKGKLPVALCFANFVASDEELAWIILYQKAKAWQNWALNKKVDHPDTVLDHMIAICANDKKPPLDQLAGYMTDHLNEFSPEPIKRAVNLLEDKKYKELPELKKRPEFDSILSGKVIEENPTMTRVRELSAQSPITPGALDTVKKGIPYACSGQVSSREAVAFVLSEYAKEWGRRSGEIIFAKYGTSSDGIKDGTRLSICPEADEVANSLDRKSLVSFLESLAEGIHYRPWLLAWARYADDESVNRMTSAFKTMLNGKAKDYYKAYSMRECLLINDTQAAMKFFDRIGELDRYAGMRGTSAMAMRDSAMLPDFGFDADGIKRYDIGGNTIEVSITPDLGFRLYDTDAQKEIRSFPRKSADPKKAEACAKEYGEFRKMVLDFARARSGLIHRMHISGEYLGQELWHKVYVDHPVIRRLAGLLVWEDETRQTFMVDDGIMIDLNGKAYEPQGKIRVAHVLDMSAETIHGWQQVLAKTGKKQLFEQVWEPVIHWNHEDIPERYSGTVLSYKERNELKKALKAHGIDAGSGTMDSDYHPRTGYTFSNKGELIIGTCLSIDYTVDPDQETLTFKKSHLRNGKAAREMNAVLLEVDKAAVKTLITKDNASVLTEILLSDFTAAQIASFTNLAVESKATACTAVLLEYKNKHFPEYADVNEFSLDW